VKRLDRAFAREAADWSQRIDPATLRTFRRALDAAHQTLAERELADTRLDRVRTVCAECLVAERLLSSGCHVTYELETPSGRHVDFRAERDGAILDIHVKRAPHPTLEDQPGVVTPAWRALEDVRRGIVVALALAKNLRGRALHAALDEAFDFVEQASVGDEIAFRDAEARTAARLRVIAPSPSGHVELVPDQSASFDGHVPRFQATLRKAFAQFMPRSENVIVVCGSTGGFEAFATALLGSHIERWDRRPKPGELVAYGRGGDGFWSGSMRNQSRMAVYWALDPLAQPLLFVREPRATGERPKGALALARSIFA
jgi:hypothetical protein